MIELFPGNYAWSQAALRAMFVGGSPGDVLHAVERLATAAAEPTADAGQWHDVWRELGNRTAERAAASSARGSRVTARSSWRRAAIYRQWAAAFIPRSDARRAVALHEALAAFAEYAALCSPPIERIEVPYEDASFPAWLVRPPGSGPHPAVVYLPGWDSTKEQGIGLAAALAERGIATLLCDGPGIGEAVERGMPNRHDYEVPGAAAFDALAAAGGIDRERIGVVGSSLGGYRAARFAAFESRLAATVIWGAIWDFGAAWRRQLERPGSALPTNEDHALAVMGAETLDEVAERLRPWTLEGVAEGISSPLLILHGAADSQIPVAEAERLHATARSTRKDLVVFERGESGSAHCQNDNRVLAHEAIGDWLAGVLRTG